MDTDISRWGTFEDRIVASTDRILSMIDDRKATFFVLGYVAEHHPELVTRIHDAGHEIGTHGYAHKAITKQSPTQFERDLLKSIKIIESIIEEKVYGHRACQFTVMKSTSWSIDIMKACGLKYDSSIFPVKTPLYGEPDAPYFPYQISSDDIITESNDDSFLEFPLSIYHTPFKNFPVAGGFYLRFFPYSFINHSVKKINAQEKPAVVYLHPWELDTNHPKLPDFKWYHYYNLHKMENRFEQLLNDFEFTSIKEWLNDKRCGRIF